MFKAVIGVFVGLALLFSVIVGVGYAKAWWIRHPGSEIVNAQTDQTRQSNQYITSQTERINTLMTTYLGLEPGNPQRIALINEMWDIKGTLPQERLSVEQQTFFAQHPRGSK